MIPETNEVDCYGGNAYYATKAVCEYWMHGTCAQSLGVVGIGSYEIVADAIQKPVYLKHVVEDNIIESTEVCLWYNNNEFCLGPNYWVETGNGDASHWSQENGVATKNKLQAAMETALGTQADSCGSDSGNAYCDFGEFSCSAYLDGDVGCSDDYSGYCEVNGDGSSFCVW